LSCNGSRRERLLLAEVPSSSFPPSDEDKLIRAKGSVGTAMLCSPVSSDVLLGTDCTYSAGLSSASKVISSSSPPSWIVIPSNNSRRSSGVLPSGPLPNEGNVSALRAAGSISSAFRTLYVDWRVSLRYRLKDLFGSGYASS